MHRAVKRVRFTEQASRGFTFDPLTSDHEDRHDRIKIADQGVLTVWYFDSGANRLELLLCHPVQTHGHARDNYLISQDLTAEIQKARPYYAVSEDIIEQLDLQKFYLIHPGHKEDGDCTIANDEDHLLRLFNVGRNCLVGNCDLPKEACKIRSPNFLGWSVPFEVRPKTGMQLVQFDGRSHNDAFPDEASNRGVAPSQFSGLDFDSASIESDLGDGDSDSSWIPRSTISSGRRIEGPAASLGPSGGLIVDATKASEIRRFKTQKPKGNRDDPILLDSEDEEDQLRSQHYEQPMFDMTTDQDLWSSYEASQLANGSAEGMEGDAHPILEEQQEREKEAWKLGNNEHFDPDTVKQVEDLYGFETEDDWFRYIPGMMRTKGQDSRPGNQYLKPHQLIAVTVALQNSHSNKVLIQASEQGTGKTLVGLVITQFTYSIACMRDHVQKHITQHSRGNKGTCRVASQARWWPFAYCICERNCPDYIKRVSQSADGLQIIMVMPCVLNQWLDTFNRWFDRDSLPEADRDYLIRPIAVYEQLDSRLREYHYSSEHNRKAFRTLCYGKSRDTIASRWPLLCSLAQRRNKFPETLFNNTFTTVMVDEFHKIKNAGTNLYQFLERTLYKQDARSRAELLKRKAKDNPKTLDLIRDQMPVLILMSGTPWEVGLCDIPAAVEFWNKLWAKRDTQKDLSRSDKIILHDLQKYCSVDRCVTDYMKNFLAVRRCSKIMAQSSKGSNAWQKANLAYAEAERNLAAFWKEIESPLKPVLVRQMMCSQFKGRRMVDVPAPEIHEVDVPYTQAQRELVEKATAQVKTALTEYEANEETEARGLQNTAKLQAHLDLRKVYAIFPALIDLKIPNFRKYDLEELNQPIRTANEGLPGPFDPYLDTLLESSPRTQDVIGRIKAYEAAEPDSEPISALVMLNKPVAAYSTTRILQKELKHLGLNVVLFNAAPNSKYRSRLNVEFQAAPRSRHVKRANHIHIMVGTADMMATGYDFQRAKFIFTMQPLPQGLQAQAESRLFRQGQTNVPVFIRYSCPWIWWEELILNINALKRGWIPIHKDCGEQRKMLKKDQRKKEKQDVEILHTRSLRTGRVTKQYHRSHRY